MLSDAVYPLDDVHLKHAHGVVLSLPTVELGHHPTSGINDQLQRAKSSVRTEDGVFEFAELPQKFLVIQDEAVRRFNRTRCDGQPNKRRHDVYRERIVLVKQVGDTLLVRLVQLDENLVADRIIVVLVPAAVPIEIQRLEHLLEQIAETHGLLAPSVPLKLRCARRQKQFAVRKGIERAGDETNVRVSKTLIHRTRIDLVYVCKAVIDYHRNVTVGRNHEAIFIVQREHAHFVAVALFQHYVAGVQIIVSKLDRFLGDVQRHQNHFDTRQQCLDGNVVLLPDDLRQRVSFDIIEKEDKLRHRMIASDKRMVGGRTGVDFHKIAVDQPHEHGTLQIVQPFCDRTFVVSEVIDMLRYLENNQLTGSTFQQSSDTLFSLLKELFEFISGAF